MKTEVDKCNAYWHAIFHTIKSDLISVISAEEGSALHMLRVGEVDDARIRASGGGVLRIRSRSH